MMKTIVSILLLIFLLCGVGTAQHISSPTNHNLDFGSITDELHIISSHQHPFYFGNETTKKASTRPDNETDNLSCLSFDPLAGIYIYDVWMTNRTTWDSAAEVYVFSPEDLSVYVHFSCYVYEDPPDASVVWIDPDGDAYYTYTFSNIEDGYQHWRSGIYVKGHYPEDHLGEWQAYVYFNGELISIRRFWIGTPAPSSSNSPPVAEIGDNQTIHIGDGFVADGHRSYDLDGNIMSYNWTWESSRRPDWSYNWSSIRDVWYTSYWSPVFEPFFYDFMLTVTDDDGATDTARKRITIEPTTWDLADDDSDEIPNVLDQNPDDPDTHISWDVGKYAVYDVMEDDAIAGYLIETCMDPVLINGYRFYVLNRSGYYNDVKYLTLAGRTYKSVAANYTSYTVASDWISWNYTDIGIETITTPAGTFECRVVDAEGCYSSAFYIHSSRRGGGGGGCYHTRYWQPIPWDSVGWNIKIVSYNISDIPWRTWILTDYSGKPVRGDLNTDAEITPADAVIALEIAAGSRPCDAAMLAAADVSGDDMVTSLDALMILQAVVGAIKL